MNAQEKTNFCDLVTLFFVKTYYCLLSKGENSDFYQEKWHYIQHLSIKVIIEAITNPAINP